MVEQLANSRQTAVYVSPLNKLTAEDVERAEKFRGPVQKAIKTLESSLQKPKAHVYPRILLAHEITKATIDEKSQAGEDAQERLKAIELCVDFTIPVFYQDSTALSKLKKYEAFVQNCSLRDMLQRRMVETPDLAITHSRSGEEDLKKAEELLKKTKGEPILAIGIGHRGLRRAMDLFLDYRSKSDTPDSIFWPVRYSSHYGDLVPSVREEERQRLVDMAKGKRIVVISPPDIFPVRFNGRTVFKNRLMVSQAYFDQLVFGSEKNPAEVIPVSVSVAKLRK